MLVCTPSNATEACGLLKRLNVVNVNLRDMTDKRKRLKLAACLLFESEGLTVASRFKL